MATPRAARGGAGSAAAEASSPPVLALSHFCGSPFVSFGTVRVGAARTRALVLHNPHEEALAVELSLRRAASLGFSAWPRRTDSAGPYGALWRGYSWRKKNDCAIIKAIRWRLQAVSKNVNEDCKLYRRMAHALYLLKYMHLSGILVALKHLEVVTRLSPLCCENISKTEAISKIIVLIRSCNRSVPCMDIITYAVQVLLNIAKYDNTASAVYDAENCIDTLLELLQMYREKPGDKVAEKSGSIFTKTCCLLAVLLRTRNRASDVQSRHKIIDHIHSLYKFIAHKQKLNAERIFDKQKQNPCKSFSFIPATPLRTLMVSKLKPHWDLRRDNIKEIKNSLQAIKMLMDTLDIPY